MVIKVRADQRAEACIAVAAACADVYTGLSGRFPDEGLWRELAGAARDRAVWLQTARGGMEDDLVDYLENESMPFINVALERARALKKRLQDNDLTLEDALTMSLELEKSAVEGYFWDVMTVETQLDAIGRLKQLIEKGQANGRKILGFMTERGIAHKGFRPEIPSA